MDINIILYNTETNKSNFKLFYGIRPWGILLAISKGSFRLTFPKLKQNFVISAYEIAYVPPNTEFCREVIEPIDFHQFAFHIYNPSNSCTTLTGGKLNIPKNQVKSILNSADKISFFPTRSIQLSEHILQRILVDNYLFSSKTTTSQISQDISLISSYIIQNLNKPLSVAELAEKLHLSHNGLIWKFKKELNTTPVNYIAICRIKRAKQLLLDSDMTISQIAEKCGYANSYYFSSAFKKREGISPSNFRKKFIK